MNIGAHYQQGISRPHADFGGMGRGESGDGVGVAFDQKPEQYFLIIQYSLFWLILNIK